MSPTLPIAAVDEISVFLPLLSAGGRYVFEIANRAVRVLFIDDLQIASAGRHDRGEHQGAVLVGGAAQRNRTPLIVRPQLQPALAVEPIDADSSEPVTHPFAAVQVGYEG